MGISSGVVLDSVKESDFSSKLNQKGGSNSQDWSYLVPLVGTIALGILLVPNFALGFAVGAVMLPIKIMIAIRLPSVPVTNEERKYNKVVDSRPLDVALFCPILEEAIFRGAVQPSIAACIARAIPATCGPLLGPAITIARAISIVATSIFFGLLHYDNYKTAHIQVIFATFGGIIQGLLAVQYGFPAAMGAHIANNAIITIGARLPLRQKPLSKNGAFN